MPKLPYVTYGPANDAAIKAAFRADMNGADFGGWLYNGVNNPFGTADLGYYVGYVTPALLRPRATRRPRSRRCWSWLCRSGGGAGLRDASGYLDEGAGSGI